MKLLAKKHTGMKISASGVLGRIRDGWKADKFLRWGCGEMLKHFEQMAKEYYKGNISICDEFFQLYCLGEEEREQLAKAEARQ